MKSLSIVHIIKVAFVLFRKLLQNFPPSMKNVVCGHFLSLISVFVFDDEIIFQILNDKHVYFFKSADY